MLHLFVHVLYETISRRPLFRQVALLGAVVMSLRIAGLMAAERDPQVDLTALPADARGTRQVRKPAPRACGDGPPPSRSRRFWCNCSPRVRGCSFARLRGRGLVCASAPVARG